MQKAKGGLAAIAFMFDDGLGSSRLLFKGGLALGVSRRLSGSDAGDELRYCIRQGPAGRDLAEVQTRIKHCYEHGTRPLTPTVYDLDDLLPLGETS